MLTLEAATTRATGIFKRYGRTFPWVLRDVDLTVEPGAFTVIVGANGSGKSTLMKVLAGVTRPTLGTVTTRPAEVGYVPERLPERIRMTGRTYLGHMARLRGLDRDHAHRRSESLAEALALEPGLDAPVTALSKGNRQKVCLAQALVAPVGLLVLDEPWSGLDPAADEGLRRELANARQAGAAVIATSHRVGAVAGADHTFVLVNGHLELPSPDGAKTGTHGGRAGRGTDMVRVDLLAPAGTDSTSELPPWARVGSAQRSGDLWALAVRRDRVDGLLANALRAGWSVQRVEPRPTPTSEQRSDS